MANPTLCITTYIPESIDRVRQLAAEEDRSTSAILRRLVREALAVRDRETRQAA